MSWDVLIATFPFLFDVFLLATIEPFVTLPIKSAVL
jgi:hypothetical protein